MCYIVVMQVWRHQIIGQKCLFWVLCFRKRIVLPDWKQIIIIVLPRQFLWRVLFLPRKCFSPKVNFLKIFICVLLIETYKFVIQSNTILDTPHVQNKQHKTSNIIYDTSRFWEHILDNVVASLTSTMTSCFLRYDAL